MIEKFDEGRSKRVYDICIGDESWIYQYDPETKRQSSIWVFPGEAVPMKFKRSRSFGKQMVASFFSKKGHIASIPLEEQRTVTANWYIDVCIPRVFHAWQSARPKTGLGGLLWHHDNASAHTAGKTIDFLTQNGVTSKCFYYNKRASLACAARRADTLCPPEAPFIRLKVTLVNY